MFDFLFKRDKNNKATVSNTVENSKNSFESLNEQVSWLITNGWLVDSKYNKENKNILIMDDSEEIILSILDDLRSIDSPHFNLSKFNIITVSTKMAGFDVLEIIKNADRIKIDFALLDIVLGGKKDIDGIRKMLDGVDIAIELLKNNPAVHLLFFSGCIIEETNDSLHFRTRFENFVGEDMNDYIIPKDIDFEDGLNKLTKFFVGF